MRRISRRSVWMAGVALAFVAPAQARMPATPDRRSGSTLFGRLAGLFLAILRAPDQVADFVQGVQLRSFLQNVAGTLARLISAKRKILFELERTTCAASNDPNVRRAATAAGQMMADIGALDRQIHDLSRAIKPGAIQGQASDVSSALDAFRISKGWAGDVNRFCSMTIVDRNRLKREIKASLAYGERCRARLDRLIAALA
jgi:hypothetical protein